MKNEITVFEQSGQLMTDSREVAMLIEMRHSDLLEKVSGYEKYLLNGDFRSVDFFMPSTYEDSTGRTLPCYQLTKKGCDMVANKLTGKKGVLFTAKYVTAFEKMQEFIKSGERYSNTVPFSEYIKSVDIVAGSLRVNDASKILMLGKAFGSYGLPTEFLPKYELNGSRQLKSATAMLKQIGINMSAVKFNGLMIQNGLLEKKSRQSSSGKLKYFNSLTETGLKYGENAVSPQNQRETQPLYYEGSFMELVEIVSAERCG